VPRVAAVALIVLTILACAHRPAPAERTPEPPAPSAPSGMQQPTVAEPAEPRARAETQTGYATWYGRSLAGRRTASGDRFDPSKMTAAHRTLPFGTWVEVRWIDTGRTVRVRITDRGPFGHESRIIDVSERAARQLGILKSGVVRVELRVVDGP
jgi:rare lipoprotein A